MRKYYKGAFQPYLEKVFLEKFERLGRGPLDKLTVLVPSNLVAEYLSRELVKRFGGVAGTEIVTIEGLARPFIDNALANRGLSALPSQAAKILLRRAAEKVLKPGDRLYQLRSMRGIPPALWNTIADLKEARIAVAELMDASNKLPDPAKVGELARVWETYENMKADSGFCDDKDRYYLAIEDLKAEAPKLDAPVFIYGVYDVTHLQKEIINAYLGENDAVAFVPWYEQEKGFVKPFIDFLGSEGFEEIGTETDAPSSGPTVELKERLFNISDNTGAIKHSDEVRLFSGAGKYHESRESIRSLLEWCDKRGMHLDEVAIILRNAETYEPLFREILLKAQIPYRTAMGTSLVTTPTGRALSALVNIIPVNMRSSVAVAGFIDGSPLNVNPEIWMRLARRAGIVDWSAGWRRKLDRYADILKEKNKDVPDPEDADIIDLEFRETKYLFSYISDLLQALDDIPREGQWHEMTDKIRTIYRARIDSSEYGFFDVISLLDNLAGMSEAVGKCHINEFIQAVEEALKSNYIKSPSETDNGILIADIMHTRVTPFRAVAIPGLCRGGFPTPFREDPLLLDAEREMLAKALPRCYPMDLKKRRVEEERFLFMLAVGSARETLALSYPRTDALSDAPQFPSSFFIEAYEAIEGRPIRGKDIAALHRQTPAFPLHPSQLEKALDKAEAIGWLAEHKPESLSSNPFFRNGVEAIASRNANIYSPFDGIVTDEVLKEKIVQLFKRRDGWVISPGRMEKYATCPFSFFLGSILEVGAAEEPDEEDAISALDLGSLYHRILNRFYRQMRDTGKLPLSEKNFQDCKIALKNITGEEIERLKRNGIPLGRGMLQNIIEDEILDDVIAVITEDKSSEWLPSYFEVSVAAGYPGEEIDDKLGADEPIQIDIGNISLNIRCRIDRVDISEDGKYARIIDYKTGAGNTFRNNRLIGGVQIQVPIYCLVAEKLLEDKGIEVSEGSYWFIQRSRVSTKGAKLVTVGEAMENIDGALRLVIECIEGGLFHQHCEGERDYACRNYCRFARACIEFPEVLKSRKGKDSALEKWDKLKEIE